MRFWLLSLGYIVVTSMGAIVGRVWFDRAAEAERLGFNTYFERYYAARAGFRTGPEYRYWLNNERVKEQMLQQQKEQEDAPKLACFAAQQAIGEKLATRDSKFPSCLQYPGHVSPDGPNRWVAHSWVETPDASGIYRQHGYEVSVSYDPAGRMFHTFILSLR
jgi:hypothetical protein